MLFARRLIQSLDIFDMVKKKAVLSWSSGKDSAWSLHLLRQNPDVAVVGLLTTINELHKRVAMHAVRTTLLEEQAKSVGLPLRMINIPSPCSNEQYESAMKRAIVEIKQQGVEQIAYGDLFLEDVRAYREVQLAGTGLAPIFPLWRIPTAELAREMIGSGVRAVVTCVDPGQLSGGFAGREYDESFLADLPDGVDACGERGEFHTFTYAGPMFQEAIRVRVGEVVERGDFVFADVGHI
jgi:uncharacterized protein (TIGR00290 family)